MIVRVRLTAPLGALRERNLALLVGSTGISTLGTGMAQVALAFAVLKIGTATDLGYVLVAREIPIVVFLLLGGVWADRVSRHRLLVGGDLISGAAQATGAGLLLVGGATVWNLALLQIAFGVASAFTRPASVGLVPQVVKPEHLQQANALIDLSRSTLRIAGPAIGGAIVVAANPGWALAVDAATFFVSALMRGAMRIPKAADHVRGVGIVADLRDGWREFVSRSWVWAMVAGFGVFQLTLFPALLVLGPVVAKAHLGGAGAWGAILACQAAGSVAGGVAALRLRFRRPLVSNWILCLPIAGLLVLLGAAVPVWIMCTVGLLASAGLTAADIVWTTVLQQRIPPHALSRIASFDWFGSVALNPIGYVLVGPVSSAIGVASTLYLAGAINAVTGLLVMVMPSVRAIRTEAATPAATVTV
jgi:MFS family permease